MEAMSEARALLVRTAIRALVVAGLIAGCDDPICGSELFVAIQTSHVASDSDAATPGVQADVRVRTSLAEGELVTLEVLSEAGGSLATTTTSVGPGGVAVFAGVTVSPPATRLRASVDVECGRASDELVADVTAGVGCELALEPVPEPNPFYAPRGVLAMATDPDPATPGFQATIVVTTRAGFTVELFETTAEGEHGAGLATADDGGVVRFARTLADGDVAFRALCQGAGTAASSLAIAAFVDTTPPSCALVAPAPGSTITPAFDDNDDLDDGLQLAIALHVAGADVLGEPTTLELVADGGAPVAIATTPVGADGGSTGQATLAPPPAAFSLALSARDHAGNTCTAAHAFEVVLDGCDLAIVSPTGPVTSDADGNPGNGTQVDLELFVSPACAGQTVFGVCGLGSPSGIVSPTGEVSLRVDLCSTSPCEIAAPCSFEVTTPDGVTTTTSTTIVFDDQGPEATVAIVSPALACNVQITPATDADPTTDGVQLVARVAAPGADTRQLELDNAAGLATLDASGDVTITIQPGTNRLVGVGVDALGNAGRSSPCLITLADITVSFAPPAADGTLARHEGTVAGNQITFPLCGTVSRPNASVALTIDGAPPVPAQVTGTTWCRTVTLDESPPSHTIVAAATQGFSSGSASLVLRVDLTLPPPVDGLLALATDRRTIQLTWESPSDGGQRVASYLAKIATVPFTAQNFDTTGTVLPTATPRPPGGDELLVVTPVAVELAHFVAIATLDAAGNRTLAFAGPITPRFDRSGAILPPDPSLGVLNLGAAIVHGRFDDDDFDDLAVAAPLQNVGNLGRAGAVYIYFGGPNGIATVPDAILLGTVANARFGAGLAAVRWSSATRHDLVVGAPRQDAHGRVLVFRGGASFTAGTRAATTAELVIAADPAQPGFFTTSALGSALATADVDGDGVDDLVAAAPGGGNDSGGVAILYGDTIPAGPATILLSELASAGAGGTIVELFRDPDPAPGHRLGSFLHAVGPTEGPVDATDDLVIAYQDDRTTAGDPLFVLRGDGSRPLIPGITTRAFAPGRDARIEYVTSQLRSDWGAQATTIGDLDGDGARELVISAHRAGSLRGQVVILSGAVFGSLRTTDPGAVLATIDGPPSGRFGAIVLATDPASDIDGDGLDDLLVVGVLGGTPTGFVWYGNAMPTGTTSFASARSTFPAPATFTFSNTPAGALGVARFVGDLDGDGLGDICWASPYDDDRDGSFEVLD
jgi:hypothetical protein